VKFYPAENEQFLL